VITWGKSILLINSVKQGFKMCEKKFSEEFFFNMLENMKKCHFLWITLFLLSDLDTNDF